MKSFVLFALVLALFAVPAIGQVPGVRGMIEKKLHDAQAERDQQAQEAGVGTATPAKTPAPVPAKDPNKDTGWFDYIATDGTKVHLYVAHPHLEAGQTPNWPALVVVQEWWGVNDDIIQRTEEFAGKGYYAVAVDLYDGKVAKDAKEAAALKANLKDAAAVARLRAGLNFVTDRTKIKLVDPAKIGMVGWCMGGTAALQTAVVDARVKALAIFYPGSPETDAAKLKAIPGPVFGVFGNTDKNPDPATVDKLDKVLDEAKIVHEFHRYDGVGHAFASRSAAVMGAYNEPKAKEAWDAFYAWLEKNLPAAKKP